MRTREQLGLAMEACRDQILAILRDHEESVHSGEVCMGERVNIVAYVAHTVGVPLEGLGHVGRAMILYEQNCPHCRGEEEADGSPQSG